MMTLIGAIVSDVLLHQLTHQTDSTSDHSRPTLFVVDSLPHNFVVKCIEVRAVRGQKSGSSYWLHYCKFRLEAKNDVQNFRVDTAPEKITISRIYQK